MTEAERRWHHRAPLPQGPIEAGGILLRDGSSAQLRPVEPDDEGRLRRFLEEVSTEARRRRFFGNVAQDDAVDRLLRHGPSEERRSLVVLAGDGPDERIVAHGSFERIEGDRAEVAFLVHDAYQGKGLGTLLLERLALLAARHGIRRFHAPTEAGNVRMREVFHDSGFDVEETRDGAEVEASFSIEPSERSVRQAEMRERLATVASLVPFLKPKHVALVGASRDPASVSYKILLNLVVGRFEGPVYPVNARAEVVGSIPAYPSVEELPGPVDLAIVAVPQAAVPAVVEQCGARGVRALAIISAGFAETGEAGRRAQETVVRRARAFGMRIVGPNCLGLLNTADDVRLNASFAPGTPPQGSLAMASQSGALGLAVLQYARELGMGLSSFVSLGNKADVSGNDLIQYWEDDPNTRAILLYLESFGNPRRFARLARRVGRSKPIVVVKAGRSAAGERAASSHTAALAASEAATEALFHQAGILRADTLESMFDVASLLAAQPLPAGPRVAVVTNAGGPAILAVDALQAGGLGVPEPGAALVKRLRDFLPAAASAGNPVDMIASADADHYRETVAAVLADDAFDAVLTIFTPIGLEASERVADALRGALRDARADGLTKPMLACFMGDDPEGLVDDAERIPNYAFPESAARALSAAHGYAAWRRAPLGGVPEFEDADEDAARVRVRRGREAGGGWLDAGDVAALLESYGLPMLPQRLAHDADEAARAAEALGFPTAVKLASRTLIHKSDWDGVHLDLPDAEAVREACRAIEARVAEAGRSDELEGFLVQPMAPAEGTEVMMGVAPDPAFGPLVAFGLGGVYVEALRDVVFRITPLTDRDAHDMVRGIRGARLLEGFRGAPPADRAALEETLLRLARLVDDHPDITEVDLNPVLARPRGEGCTILDARVRVAAAAGEGEAA